ncbi:glucose-6-phosphate isomerase [Treponema sp. OMZ 792]|uniref:glucose-6-phosphate isomerase n=1 Tax=unclassified Treponema TaxID=2638727 RepID=UPI0020A39C5E|nr:MULTISPECIES: glucose-6-phosphate isomerase [unclassified Treponema]UTC74526.1 glucose-6-phosphate isomerase [Treponema sp. OMZ 792]UTC80921.1 glucose-6-phosphate isomerase [Treponema sp. OMZ 798]
MEWKNLNTCKSFTKLQEVHKEQAKNLNLADIFNKENSCERVASYQVKMGGSLKYNYAAKPVNEEILKALQALSDEQNLIEKYELLLNGDFINTGENRMVLHQLTRGQLKNDVVYKGVNMRSFYLKELAKIKEFSEAVHSGKIKTSTGNTFTDVVQIGIGGSDLGPRAMYIALKNWAKTNGKHKMRAHFISNVDPDDAAEVLNSIDLASSLFILVSKSGTTQETLANERFVKSVLEKNGLDSKKQMLAVTSETSPLANNPDYLTSFYMDDFIGGRYSSTSVCGAAVLALAFGMETVDAFLKGAAAGDKLSLNKNIKENASLLDALLGVYERNVLSYSATAILPYSQALSRFPAHLQQLDMESNGKTVNRFGEKISYKTGPVIFGEPGTNGQHSFYQLLHQGSDIIPLQFIGFKKSQIGLDVESEGSTNMQKLNANLAAQIMAFAAGKTDENKNKDFAGNRPASLIYGEELNPENLGALLAHYENKVMFQGFIWNLNSFDQEGVQLGKTLAKKVLSKDMPPALKAFSELL